MLELKKLALGKLVIVCFPALIRLASSSPSLGKDMKQTDQSMHYLKYNITLRLSHGRTQQQISGIPYSPNSPNINVISEDTPSKAF